MLEFPLKKLNIINYFLIAFILFLTLLLTRDIISTVFFKTGRALEPKTTTETTQQVKNIMNYAPVVEKNPFGAPMNFYPLTTRSISNRQGSPAELVLIGTATGPRDLSYAILLDKSQAGPLRQEVFAYGKDVYGYGTLTRIEREFVELSQGADIYTIYFEDIQTEKLHTDGSASQFQFAKKINERQYLLDRGKVLQALESPEQLLSDARLYPNIKNGKQKGFLVQEIIPGGIYDSLGLRNEDILLRINGLEISNPEVAIQAMSALRGMNSIELDIIRNNSKMSMSYQIK